MSKEFMGAFSHPFKRPPEGAQLVLLSQGKPAIPERQTRQYLSHAIQYAQQFGVYLLTGRFVLEHRLCLCLLSPEGKALALQKALHLNLLHSAQLLPETAVTVTDTPFGRVFLAVDVDIYHQEVLRAAALQGADLVLCSQHFDNGDLSTQRLVLGGWSAAQQNAMAVITTYTGGSSIALPAPVTTERSGYMLPPSDEYPRIFQLDMQKLAIFRDRHNPLLYLPEGLVTQHTGLLAR